MGGSEFGGDWSLTATGLPLLAHSRELMRTPTQSALESFIRGYNTQRNYFVKRHRRASFSDLSITSYALRENANPRAEGMRFSYQDIRGCVETLYGRLQSELDRLGRAAKVGPLYKQQLHAQEAIDKARQELLQLMAAPIPGPVRVLLEKHWYQLVAVVPATEVEALREKELFETLFNAWRTCHHLGTKAALEEYLSAAEWVIASPHYEPSRNGPELALLESLTAQLESALMLEYEEGV